MSAPSLLDRDKLLLEMEQAVLCAAHYLLSKMRTPSTIQTWRKADGSVVTSLDIDSQRILTEKLTPFLPVVSEEDLSSHHLVEVGNTYLVVDPLDGTASCRRYMSTQGGQIGFGPLVGLVEQGKLMSATFYHIPLRTLFSAARGKGCHALPVSLSDAGSRGAFSLPPLSSRGKLQVNQATLLSEAALLFYPGNKGEMEFVEHLRAHTEIENTYRFGGFANDCTRLAVGLEQAHIQFAVKAWDFPAALFCAEAGLKVCVNPSAGSTDFYDWLVEKNNPVLTATPNLHQPLLELLREVLRASA